MSHDSVTGAGQGIGLWAGFNLSSFGCLHKYLVISIIEVIKTVISFFLYKKRILKQIIKQGAQHSTDC